MSENRKVAAILAADVVGYSRLARTDEDRTLARLRALRSDLIDPTIAVHKGRVVKRTGDGALVEFRSVVDAVRCAIEVQTAMVERNTGVPQERRIEFRIGIHLGDVVEESDGDLMGDGVNIAARLEGVAEPGAICLSEDAYRQVKSRLDISVSDLGQTQLKNIAESIRVYSLQVGVGAHAKPSVVTETPTTPTSTAPPVKLSIAVLPFANMSGDVEQDYFADGISEDIITALSKVSQLFVIARNSSFTFKGRNVNVQEVGRSLRVLYVLEGSVRKSGNRVRITAQLIDAITGGHLWAERFDRDLTDVFAVQDDVTQHIVGALALNLTEADKKKLAIEHTDNLEAYDCFLRGREQFWRFTKERNRQARELLQRASQLDPKFAPAFAFLAAAHVLDYTNKWSPLPSKSLEQADEAATRSAALDDRYPYAHWVLAITNLSMRRHDVAIREAERSIALDPNLAAGYDALGTALHYSGRSEEALTCLHQAMALNPYHPDMLLHFQAQATFQLGRYDEAVGILKRRIDLKPDTDISRVLLAACYGHLGRLDEAKAVWRDVFRVNPDYSLEHRLKINPYKNPDDFERVVDGLRKADLVE
jgi:TolB-like protein/class 3 adenylate cyclase/tetratricopeptide (TPR) repeat protein